MVELVEDQKTVAAPPSVRAQIMTVHGSEITDVRPHWRGDRKMIAATLVGGDMLLVDIRALQRLLEAACCDRSGP
jgi:hypothetical protein